MRNFHRKLNFYPLSIGYSRIPVILYNAWNNAIFLQHFFGFGGSSPSPLRASIDKSRLTRKGCTKILRRSNYLDWKFFDLHNDPNCKMNFQSYYRISILIFKKIKCIGSAEFSVRCVVVRGHRCTFQNENDIGKRDIFSVKSNAYDYCEKDWFFCNWICPGFYRRSYWTY